MTESFVGSAGEFVEGSACREIFLFLGPIGLVISEERREIGVSVLLCGGDAALARGGARARRQRGETREREERRCVQRGVRDGRTRYQRVGRAEVEEDGGGKLVMPYCLVLARTYS